MPPSKEYQKLLNKRANYVRALQYHEPAINELDENATRSITFASTTLPLIEASYEKYKEVNEALEDEGEFEYDHLDPKDEKIVQLYVKMVSKLKDILGEGRNTMNLNSTIIHNQSQSQITHDLNCRRW